MYYTDMNCQFNFLKFFFTSNGFPVSPVNSDIKEFLQNRFVPSPLDNPSRKKFYLSLAYFGYQSEKLRFELSKLLSKYFSSIDFHIILVNNYKIGSLFPYKDKLPISLVYKFSCRQCVTEYVGSTVCTLHTWVAEHAGMSFRTGAILISSPDSNIRAPALSCSSPVSIDNFNILARGNNNIDVRILESLFIYIIKPNLNDSQSAFPLNTFPLVMYSPLGHSFLSVFPSALPSSCHTFLQSAFFDCMHF